MEQTKMTVRVPKASLERAKQFAAEHNTTLTRLISNYLDHLAQEVTAEELSPIVRRLSGSLSPEATVIDYQRYLEEKYDAAA